MSTLPKTTAPVAPNSLFRALWPILDPAMGFNELLLEAAADLPAVMVRCGVRPVDTHTGIGRFTVARSSSVPGSGNTTEWVLLWEGPVLAAEHRAYRRTTHRPGHMKAVA